MKLFHLGDLHIGKKVNGFDLLEDQAVVLDQVLDQVRLEKPDALLLAGDLYDRRNPNPEAVHLFDRFLARVVLEEGVPTLAIGGNHDSGDRLNFASGILAHAGLYLAGQLTLPVPVVRLTDAHGPVDFHLLPYADGPLLAHLDEAYAGLAYPDAMADLLARLPMDPAARQVLIAHGMVAYAGGDLAESDSERELTVGGTEYWTADALGVFDYVALGHLHRPQTAGAPHIRYAGSLLPYSFSEENHAKSISVIELDESGYAGTRLLPIQPRHAMHTVRGQLADILAGLPQGVAGDDYLRIVLTDQGDVLDAMARLRKVYPNVMTLEREIRPETGGSTAITYSRAKGLNPVDYATIFYEEMTGEPADEAIRAIFTDTWQQAREEGL
ncbi:exonuclease SbcCD subunit D [Peptococcus simiae]|uniref:Nuclease SbcCD subunit D n=1 Tax=Peptococcus simiae TaxID=1643805 RepID=A0ABW9GYH9_9FIRM